MVSKATHTACYEIQTLIGFINYTACYILVLRAVAKSKYMAVARPIPSCQFCGKPIAKAICKSYKDVPFFMQPIGDSFIRWEFFDCKCKEAKKARKEHKKWKKEHGIDMSKI